MQPLAQSRHAGAELGVHPAFEYSSTLQSALTLVPYTVLLIPKPCF